jgi:histidinol-phosphate phosphatase family protein
VTGRPTQAVILAGGRGTRMQPLTDTRPKAMIEFHGKPFLEYVIELLRDQGFSEILLLLGYLPDVIVRHFGDGTAHGVSITYSITEPDDLTAHRMKVAAPELHDLFLLLYCDNYWPLQMDDLWRRYRRSGNPAQITVYANEDGYSRDSVIVAEDGTVEVFDRTRTTPGLSGVEISYAILPRTVLDLLPEQDELFEQAVYPQLVARRELGAFVTRHRYYSVGTVAKLPLTEAFFARLPTVFLDRDGVLNEKPPRAEYVRAPDEFRWLPGALDALRELSDAGFRVIVVSNQAGIARGAMTEADLEAVHRKLRAEAEEAGGRIDAIYYCPHGWDEGCDCRKPNPGMLFRAQREHHLDLTRTTFIGDDERDAEAAIAAGCTPVLVSDQLTLGTVVAELVAEQAEVAA